jgi:hypothetical protein
LTIILVTGVALTVPASAVPVAKPLRSDPVVLAGSSLPDLGGVTSDELVAFRYRDARHAKGRWKQVPVQLDERRELDFGSAPPNNSAVGTEGTVYGTAPIGVSEVQYADPGTFVGADPVAGLDGDDEVALITADAGDKAGRRVRRPKGTSGPPTAIRIADPLGGPTSYLYLYRSKGGLDPTAGKDYVDYEFRLAGGDYRPTYRRADGPNPETSTVTTGAYEIGFSDRWYYDSLAVKAGGANGAEILDGFKFGFSPTSCARSEATFNDAEGAFVANLDGPVRAIRSYVGANSGPLTERTHYFYPDRHLIVTDLRVHAITGALTFHDLSAAGMGMTYLDSSNPAGATVDGTPDALADAVPDWRVWTGPQGSLFSTDRAEGDLAASLLAAAHDWYLDDLTPEPNAQCWGDAQAYGQGGLRSTAAFPNTDPSRPPAASLRLTTSDVLGAPGMTAAAAERLAQELDTPLRAQVKGR